jgi:hypothetical protein
MDRSIGKILLSMAVVACLAALAAGTALASSSALILECNSYGTINGKYSVADLKNALANLPADVNQYSDCRSLIQQALLNKISKHGGGGSTIDPKTLNQITTAGQRKRAAAQAEASAAVPLPANGAVAKLNGVKVQRSGARTLASSAAPGIPAALIVAIAGLLLLLGGDLAGRVVGVPGLKRFWRDPRRRGS